MAISDSQKVDLLYKKLFGVTKTDLPANKSPSNEATASPALIRGDTVWQQSDQIPATAAAVTDIVQSYQTTARIQCVADTTSTPISSVYPSWKTSLTDWIPPEFGATYFVKVYADTAAAADPTVTGTQLSDSGIAGVGEWNFDYQAGVLNFIGGTIPAALTAVKVIFITGYRYVGTKGIGGYSNIANLNATTGNVSTLFAGNLSSSNVSLTGGSISGMSNISATTGNVASWYATQVNSSSANVYGPLYANSVSTANAVISGGYISAMTNATITTANISSLYATTLNSTVGNITTLVAANFSTANAIIASGIIYNVNLQANNFSTANALITGGVLNNIDVQANNFSTANAVISSGNVTANIAGNVTGTFAAFDGNVNAAWLIGNVDGTIGNFSTIVNTGNMVVGGSYINGTTAVLEEITITANTIRSNSTDLVISANTANPNNIIKFDSVSAIDIPTGTTNQRPPDPGLGYMRYNTDLDTIEFWAGTTWATTTQTISTETINPDGVNAVYTLSQVTTEAGILVNINGTVQQPGSAYTVVTDQITFAETPLTTDIIEIRYLTTGIAIAPYYGGNVGGNVNVQATTSSTSSTTGALIVAGGVGVGGTVYVGNTNGTPGPANAIVATGNVNILNSKLLILGQGGMSPNFIMQGDDEQTFRFYNSNTTPNSSTRVSWKMANRNNPDWSWIMYTDLAGNGADDFLLQNRQGRVFYAGNVGNVTLGRTSTLGNVNVAWTATSTSTTTGALIVAGGAGIAGNLHLGGNVNLNSTAGTPGNTATPASWIKVYVGGTAYFMPLYQ